jgi:hypothetical protein
MYDELDSNFLNVKRTGVQIQSDMKSKKLLSRPETVDTKSAIKRYLSSSALVGPIHGELSYNMNFRSTIDTPFAEKDIIQHIVTGRTDVDVRGMPLTVTYMVRQSNSGFFKDLADVRIAFDPGSFSRKFRSFLATEQLQRYQKIVDSAAGKNYRIKNEEFSSLSSMLRGGKRRQMLIEAHEIINVPALRKSIYSEHVTDSLSSDSLLSLAKQVVAMDSIQRLYLQNLQSEMDSLKEVYDKSLALYRELKSLATGSAPNLSPESLKRVLRSDTSLSKSFPSKYLWLLNIKSLSVGRTPVNYSDLTARNLSLNGLNFEYQSWYYAALSAGVVDFRFRDFAIGRNRQTPQPFYMLRLGLGTASSSNIIVSGFSGTKQLYTTTNSSNGISSFRVSGISLAAKYQLSRNAMISGEVAQSISPDFSGQGSFQKQTMFTLSHWNNSAVSIKGFASIPRYQTKFEGAYTKRGANFQSFGSYQTNAAFSSWFLKFDQSFFRHKLRLSGSIRTSDFSNPFVVQNYKSDMIFKSLTASFRSRKGPSISLGYQPMTQLSVVDSITLENKFQSIFFNGIQVYRIADLQATTSIFVSKFVNEVQDSAFVHYNASNWLLSQQINLQGLTISLGISRTKNRSYSLITFDEGIQVPLGVLGSASAAIKINNFNSSIVKTGFSVGSNIQIGPGQSLFVQYESGFLPSFHGSFVPSKQGNIQFNKSFSFNNKSKRH